jgi:dihydroorotate dehydrogenase electron transfer subunit
VTTEPIHHLQCEVVESNPCGAEHHRLVLRAPRIAALARPGQFLHCAPGFPSEALALLRRPISISGIPADAPDCVELVFRTIGPGTRMLATRKVREMVDCLGPLGNGFTIYPEKLALIIAGGMGVAPLRFLATHLAAQGCEVHMLVGVRTTHDLPFPTTSENKRLVLPELQTLGIQTEVVTEAQGMLVTDLLAQRLPALQARGRPIQVYAVGPRPMFRALVNVLPVDLPCEVSLEERMACGIGACRSCVVALAHGEHPGYVYRRVCRDGPVFDLREIVWHAESEID